MPQIQITPHHFKSKFYWESVIRKQMISTLTKQDSSAICHLRVLAMFSIVFCHILQALNNHWAWVLNIGVQVFLLISGYLFGHRHIDNWTDWFKKRIVKIYVPFIVYFIAILPLLVLCDLIPLKKIITYVFCMQGVVGGVAAGLGHLWFLTIIVLCYVITPVLQWFRKTSNHLIWVVVIGSFIILYLGHYGRLVSWIVLYAFGYYLATVGKREKLILSVFTAGITVYLLIHFTWESMVNMGCAWSIYFHMVGGIVVFFAVLLIFELLKLEETSKLIRILDKYSFQVYIVHYIVIMPPFSMLYVTDSFILNVAIILYFISFYTFVLTTASNYFVEFIEEKFALYTKQRK